MPKLQKRIPKLCKHHKGHAFVKIDGRQIWLGRYGEPETDEAYNRLIAEWLVNNRQLPAPQPSTPTELTVSVLIRDYLKHVEAMHTESNVQRIRYALRPLRKLYGSTPAELFGPKSLEIVRQEWMDANLKRRTINERVGCIRRMFRWAAGREIIPATVWKALDAVEGLRYGQGGKESKDVKPVPQDDIDAIKPLVSRQVWALVQLQLFAGPRGGELFGLRLSDIDMSGEVWIHRPGQHKTKHKGKRRTIAFGPQAQEVIKQFTDRPIHVPLFSPREANAESRSKNATGQRRENQKPSPRKTNRTISDEYDKNSYRRAIQRACKSAGIEQWNPHRLRHNFATRIRAQFGIEASRILLGHADVAITLQYAEADEAKAVDVISKVG